MSIVIEGKTYKKCYRCKAKKVITEEFYTQCLDCGQIYRRLPVEERKEQVRHLKERR